MFSTNANRSQGKLRSLKKIFFEFPAPGRTVRERRPNCTTSKTTLNKSWNQKVIVSICDDIIRDNRHSTRWKSESHTDELSSQKINLGKSTGKVGKSATRALRTKFQSDIYPRLGWGNSRHVSVEEKVPGTQYIPVEEWNPLLRIRQLKSGQIGHEYVQLPRI